MITFPFQEDGGAGQNIWEEPDGPDYIIMGVENGEPCIHAATLNKLVVQLTTSATPGTLSNLYSLAPVYAT